MKTPKKPKSLHSVISHRTSEMTKACAPNERGPRRTEMYNGIYDVRYKYKLILFDLDGTLINSKNDIAKSVNFVLLQLGYKPLPVEVISHFVGSGVKQLLTKTLESQFGIFIDEKILEKSLTLFQEHYFEHCLDETRWYEGVSEVIPQLLPNYRLGLLTNKPKKFAQKIIGGLGGKSWFPMMMAGGEDPPKKPDPAYALKAMEQARSTPKETLFVGDSLIDYETALRSGMDLLLVDYGFGKKEELVQAKNIPILHSFGELLPFLERV